MYTKYCPKCDQELPVTNFQWLAKRKNHRGCCRKCYNKQTSERYKNDPVARAKRRVRNLLNQLKRKQATPKWASKYRMNIIAEICDLYSDLHGVDYDMGHKFPIVSKLIAGLNIAANLRPEPASQNRANGNKFNICRFEFGQDGITYYELLFSGDWVQLEAPTWSDQTPEELCGPYCEVYHRKPGQRS